MTKGVANMNSPQQEQTKETEAYGFQFPSVFSVPFCSKNHPFHFHP